MTSSNNANLPHIAISDRASSRDFTRPGRGGSRVRRVSDRKQHGEKLRSELETALDEGVADREDLPLSLEELQATGTVLVLEGADSTHPVNLDSLQRLSRHRTTSRRPQWLLLSVVPESEDRPEQIIVWVSDEYREQFFKLFTDYLERETRAGHPLNERLIANMSAIRRAVMRDLWQSDGDPPYRGVRWWEIWLIAGASGIEDLQNYAVGLQLELSDRVMTIGERSIAWIRCTWDDLQGLPFTRVPVTEVRYPQFVDSFEDFPEAEQEEFARDLRSQIVPASSDRAAVCHLDSGIRYTHLLLSGSIHPDDVHSVVGDSGGDHQNHGTRMAGLALFGSLEEALATSSSINLTHRLESVKILPDHRSEDDPLTYGIVTAQAVALPESSSQRARTFCMPVTTYSDSTGQPSLWSASVDALSAGVDIGRSGQDLELLGVPDPTASRLFIISAGNVNSIDYQQDYKATCDTSGIADPAHAWNALTVGAFTNRTDVPKDPSFRNWMPLAAKGDVSPHSRTSVLFSRTKWPIKPEICMEGGNVLTDGVSEYDNSHPVVSILSTDNRSDLAIGSTNATSAATAQAANLAGKLMNAYPTYWPETVRGLLTHSAVWTDAMQADINGATRRRDRHTLLRRFGWGVPNESALLSSTRQSVTMITQDEFRPFDGQAHRIRNFRLHSLPWPTEVLRDLESETVSLRVTLSYFVEPTASHRGWRQRYSYASHGLRFELKGPLENQSDFIARVNRQAQDEESGGPRPGGGDRWLLGPNQRNQGSLHQDIWEGTGAELAQCGVLAVNAIGGWWKNNQRSDRADLPVRYALIISITSTKSSVDLYTPIINQLAVPIAVEVDE